MVVFAGRSGASLIASSAYSYRPGGIGPGSSVASLRRRFRRSRLRSIGGRIFVATSRHGPVVFGTRAGQVQAVAIATRRRGVLAEWISTGRGQSLGAKV